MSRAFSVTALRLLHLDIAGRCCNVRHARMDAAEYTNIAALETEHWYYSGKRRFVREWIQKARPVAVTA